MENRFFYIEEQTALKLIAQCETFGRNASKCGTRSKAYFIDNFVVLKTENILVTHTRTFKDKVPFDEIIKLLYKLKQQGVNVIPILGYSYNSEKTTGFENRLGKIEYAKGYIIQPRAKGREMWNSELFSDKNYVLMQTQTLASATEEHYVKFVADILTIIKAGISIDPAEENFFYDESIGFSFIDLTTFASINGLVIDEKIITKYAYMPYFKEIAQLKNLNPQEHKEISIYNEIIFEKCKKALQVNNLNFKK